MIRMGGFTLGNEGAGGVKGTEREVERGQRVGLIS